LLHMVLSTFFGVTAAALLFCFFPSRHIHLWPWCPSPSGGSRPPWCLPPNRASGLPALGSNSTEKA
jgi:hypothetical protein